MANGLILLCVNPVAAANPTYNPSLTPQVVDPAMTSLTGPATWVLDASGYAYNLGNYAGFIGGVAPAVNGCRKYEMWGKVANVVLTDAEGVRLIFNNKNLSYTDYWHVGLVWNSAGTAFRLNIVEVTNGAGVERAFVLVPSAVNLPAYFHLVVYEQDDSIIAQVGMYETDAITDDAAVSCVYNVGSRPHKSYTRFIFSNDQDPDSNWLIRGCRISDMAWPVSTSAIEEYVIFRDSSVGYQVRYWKIGPGGYTQLAVMEDPYPSAVGIFSNGTFIFMGVAAGAFAGQYVFNGSGYVRVLSADPGALVSNAPKSYFVVPNNPGYLVVTGAGDFGAGVQVWSFASAPTYVYGTPTSYAPGNIDWNQILDFRVGAVGSPVYGNTFVAMPSSTGQRFDAMTVSGTTITSHANLTIAGAGAGKPGHDRDTGLIAMMGSSATTIYMAQLNMTTRALSAIGNGTIAGTTVYAVTAAKGFVITWENGGNLRVYSRSGSTLTLVSTLNIGGLASVGQLAVSPYTGYIYLIGSHSGTTRVFTLSSTGILSAFITTTGITHNGNAMPICFLPAPLPVYVSTLRTNLVSWWSLNESTGTRYDSHGTNHLTVSGSVAAAGTNFFKITLGGAADFAGGKLIKAAPHGLHAGDRDFTIAGWVRMDTKSANRTFACVATDAVNPGNQDWRLQYNAVADRFRMYVNSAAGNWSATANAAGVPNAGAWYFLVAYHNNAGNLIGISVNGGAFETGTGPTTNNNIGAEFSLGLAGSSEAHDGPMDEFAFWDRLLTASEVAQLYNNGSGIPYPPAS